MHLELLKYESRTFISAAFPRMSGGTKEIEDDDRILPYPDNSANTRSSAIYATIPTLLLLHLMARWHPIINVFA